VTLADACQRILARDCKIFVLLSSNSDAVKFARRILCGKNQKRRRLAGRSIQHATQRMRRQRLLQDGLGILRHAFGIIRKNPRRLAFLENFARFL